LSLATSVYLDLVRFLAALAVFLAHASTSRFGLGIVPDLGDAGNNAVIVFFVLSGFVIAYVAEHKDKHLPEYVLSRFSRLYSVVLPALIVTVVCDSIGARVDPATYGSDWYQYDVPAIRFLASLFFMNEAWFYSIRPFSNGPFWSVAYEFWYYAIFAGFFYFKGRTAALLVALACLIAGPKILLLFPVWALGAVVYHAQKGGRLSRGFGVVLFGMSWVGLYYLYHWQVRDAWMHIEVEMFGEAWRASYLKYSRNVIGNYAVGLLVAMNFLGFAVMTHGMNRVPKLVRRPIVYVASFTFSLYLMHYPLLQLLAVVVQDGALVMVGTLVAVFAVGSVTERRKEWFRSGFAWIARRMSPGRATASG
jgi:peptidoglycan/LPS O-acetylase OafA/YrhL